MSCFFLYPQKGRKYIPLIKSIFDQVAFIKSPLHQTSAPYIQGTFNKTNISFSLTTALLVHYLLRVVSRLRRCLMWYWDGNSAGTEPGVTSDPPRDLRPSSRARERENRTTAARGKIQTSPRNPRNQTDLWFQQNVNPPSIVWSP